MGIVNITGISDSRVAFAAANITKKNDGQVLIITPTYLGANRLAMDLSFFVDKKICLMPPEDDKLFAYEAKNKDLMEQRLQTIKSIASGENCIVICPASAAIKKMPPKSVFLKNGITFSKGEDLDLKSDLTKLLDMGYERVSMIYGKGQFSLRGGILDIFTPYDETPYRIELFDTQIEDIRSFDVNTQRSIEAIKTLEIYPAHLMVRDKEAFDRGKEKIKKAYKNLPERRQELSDQIDNLSNVSQLENYIEYFYDAPEFIWDYMNGDTVIVDDPNKIYEGISARHKEFQTDFEVYLEKGLVVPSDIKQLSEKKDFLKIYDMTNVFLCTPFPKAVKGVDSFASIKNIQSRQMVSYNGKLDMLEKDLKRYIDSSYKVTIVCSTKERLNNLKDFTARCDLENRLWLKEGNLTAGMDFPEERICYITDGDIFGTYKKKRKQSRSKTRGEQIKTFADISKGDFVVHDTHGIGKFIGLEQLTVQGEKKDYLKVKYAGDDVLYVPVEQMDLIQKYIGAESGNPKISRLSGVEWRNTKQRAKASIENMAKELLELSAARKATPGYKFSKDTVWQQEFEDSFPYEETSDQIRCINEIKADMESDIAMDRLLCGDVGYGKTEVAARAMFKCAVEGKQVAMLVPTTILASQHYNTLKERFEKFPFKVDMISRFRTEKEQKGTIEEIKKGTVDVIIGTHRLLSKDIKYKDLGLLIIDEEQRFGVKHKEVIKKLKENIDVLTLSATPIPRTLHMSLIGIRDMSLIEEPPEERYPVQTYVLEEDDYIITEAIERELDRGGQVFVVHNRINGIQKIADKISKLVPGKRIGVGHGRMSETALENVMMQFVQGEIDILIATTIIESGIDIPNVNTEIIIDADKFGLSQLYQLRGRVGRSNRMAYAYLTHKKNKVLTDVAEKRLRAIREFTEFGAGFKISMRDLEIRGAGNVLGGEQHGHLVNVGYELYCKLVEDAVLKLKGETPKTPERETLVETSSSALISNSYISDEIMKLSMYKKIASIYTQQDYEDVVTELEDRFGEIPRETKNLIEVSRIKALGENLKMSKVIQKRDVVTFIYHSETAQKPVKIYLSATNNNLAEIADVMNLMTRK